MSYSLQICCDHEGCTARFPPLETVGLSFGDTESRARAAGWSSRRGAHLCRLHGAAKREHGAPAPAPEELLCEICHQAIQDEKRTVYCSARCAWEGRERKARARREAEARGEITVQRGRSGPARPETVDRLARVLGCR